MNCRKIVVGLLPSVFLALSGLAAPVIDPIADVTIPAGKSLILPITATSPSGLPLTYTIFSSTNAFAVVMHTNNPFWQLSVAQAAPTNAPGAYKTPYRKGLVTVTNVGTMTFMLFPEYAPHTVNVFQGLTDSGFYNSNTIFHRVVSNFVIQGGDPKTNGTGGLVFEYNDEFNPQAIFSGNGQLALANSGKNTDGSQFFVTVGPQRYLDFGFTLFGQLVRGFDVLTNISLTAVNTNTDRPLADEIIQTASWVTNTADTVLTLTATNIPDVTGTITVIADDGNGGLATNVFDATTVTDTNSNGQPFFCPNDTVTNLVAPKNGILTNFQNAVELDGDEIYWNPEFADQNSEKASSGSSLNITNSLLQTLTYNITNVDGQLELFVKTTTNYAGPVNIYFVMSSSTLAQEYWQFNENPPDYAQELYTFAFGDTSISAETNTVATLVSVPFTNVLLATFTNGVPGSGATNFSAFVNWGDDTTNRAVVVADAAGLKEVLGSHTYAYPGSYPVYVTVQSKIGARTTVLSYVNVTPQAAAQTNVLSVQITGLGTVSPNYNNAPLAVGGDYIMTATPATQWSFVSWTDGNGFVFGTNPTLFFTMYPGLSLTANFTNKINPVVTITNLKTGQSVSNSLFTVLGTVSPNWQLVVHYQINNTGWNPEAVGTTNWSATVNLNPGANIFQVYASDGIGTRSLTNTITINYVVSAPLQLSVTGLGTITPNDSNALLQVNKNYTLTAKAATGFAFAGWTGSLSTNNANLTFTMASNLSFTANFTDVTRPTIAITNLVTGQRLTNSVFVVRGKASDNWQLAGVEYQLNYGGWSNYPGGSNWSATLNLGSGTNIFQAYAYDTTGNHSLTNTISVDYVVSAQLQLLTTGLGTITPNDSNAWLEVGKSYTLTAKAATGFAFAGWTGSLSTNNAALTFTMASNLSFTANFTDVTRPTIAITNLLTGQRVTNGTFVVRGKASDNWRLAGVEYQLNYAGWNYIIGETNWATTTLNLQPGTNIFQAFAYDTTGNHSLTNTVAVDYVTLAQLLLQVSGSGTVTPNYSNMFLEVGRNYTMTATPAKGWEFYNWLNGDFNTLTNRATVTFMMNPGLALTANFHQPPAILGGPSNTLAFYQGGANFSVAAAGTGPLYYQWQFNSGNLPGQNSTNLGLSSLAAANAGSYRVIVNSYSQSVTSSVAKLTLTNAPVSFTGLNTILTADKVFQVEFGTNTFSLYSPQATNNNSGVGGYEYTPSGALTGQLALNFLQPPEDAGTDSVNVTFVSPGWAVFTNGGSSGAIQYFTATNLVPASWSNHKINLTSTNGTIALSLLATNIFTAVIGGNSPESGTYVAAAYSPGGAWLQLNSTGGNGVNYVELQFTTKSGGSFYLVNYDGSDNLKSEDVGAFTWK